MWDFTWATLTYTFFSFYMLLFLQPLGMVSNFGKILENMIGNYILCGLFSEHAKYARVCTCVFEGCQWQHVWHAQGHNFSYPNDKFLDVMPGTTNHNFQNQIALCYSRITFQALHFWHWVKGDLWQGLILKQFLLVMCIKLCFKTNKKASTKWWFRLPKKLDKICGFVAVCGLVCFCWEQSVV